MILMNRYRILTLLLALTLAGSTLAGKHLFGRAARSVHLGYEAPAGTAAYLEVFVEESLPGSYFCTLGFRNGYFGIQELGKDQRLVIFSVWDPVDHDKRDVKDNPDLADEKAQVLYSGKDVEVHRFGGEGTGAKTFFRHPWKDRTVYRFLVHADVQDDETVYTAMFYLPEEKAWKKLATIATRSGGLWLDGHYSFVEDFRRDGRTLKQVRRARFGNGWALSRHGTWVPMNRAKFTADENPAMDIDAGAEGRGFFLATGGGITNAHTKLWGIMEQERTAPDPPADIRNLKTLLQTEEP